MNEKVKKHLLITNVYPYQCWQIIKLTPHSGVIDLRIFLQRNRLRQNPIVYSIKMTFNSNHKINVFSIAKVQVPTDGFISKINFNLALTLNFVILGQYLPKMKIRKSRLLIRKKKKMIKRAFFYLQPRLLLKELEALCSSKDKILL